MLTPYTVAKIVIISHTLVTISVATLITQHFFTTQHNKEILYLLLAYNTITIILHMIYRIREKKLTQTFKTQSFMLIFHIATSLGAIVHAYMSENKDLDIGLYITAMALWACSLISGWLIFRKKYVQTK
jgi:hypothetical protein